MQSLASMLSPLNTSSSVSDSTMTGRNNDLQTPLSITIPPNDYEMAGTQNMGNNHYNGWGIQYTQQPLLASKSPEMDALEKLNAEVGNKYAYQFFEGASSSQFGLHNDPRMGYDKIIYTAANPLPFKDLYYQCAYGQPKPDRMAIRHKLDDDDAGPDAKRHCVGESRFGNEHSVIVPNTNVIGNGSNTQEG
ncbi:hypothetical protein CAEBREN_05808 [Caenorhabditis brenneri]|uniref:Uncharacterized protein n=1 Tax=Caenorhabditis brenneri TaxID=135651 RepID=G0M8E8_CAEBE|nr:hypothetical protein CAEBREN_05808 [Caenorhabditis brenneri]